MIHNESVLKWKMVEIGNIKKTGEHKKNNEKKRRKQNVTKTIN